MIDGKPGLRWGSGTCYPYTPGDDRSRKKAKAKALRQAAAIRATGFVEKSWIEKTSPDDPEARLMRKLADRLTPLVRASLLQGLVSFSDATRPRQPPSGSC
jgi:hypothetical protein